MYLFLALLLHSSHQDAFLHDLYGKCSNLQAKISLYTNYGPFFKSEIHSSHEILYPGVGVLEGIGKRLRAGILNRPHKHIYSFPLHYHDYIVTLARRGAFLAFSQLCQVKAEKIVFTSEFS